MIVGTCQNLIRGQREDWIDARYCGAPAIEIPGERNICQECHQRSQRFMADVIDQWVMEMRGDTEWIENTKAIIADMLVRLTALRASRAPMSKIYLFERELDHRIVLYRRVTG